MGDNVKSSLHGFWSISRIIILGFTLVLIVTFTQALLSNQSLSEFSQRFSDFKRVNEHVNLVQDIDKGVSELQRYILIYHQTSGRSSISQLKLTHEQLLMKVEELLTSDDLPSEEILVLIANLKSGIVNFEEKIESLQYQRALRDEVTGSKLGHQYAELDNYLENLLQTHKAMETPFSSDLWKLRFTVLNAESLSAQYFENHDYALLKTSLESIESAIKVIPRLSESFITSSVGNPKNDLEELLNTLKTVMHQSVQADRNYMFLVNVVMAGESSELSALAERLKLEFMKQHHNVSLETERRIINEKRQTLFISAAAFIVALLAAILVGRRIRTPLLAIAGTFDRLIKGQTVNKIPFSQRQDEIGYLAKAADIFRQNNIQTQSLLAQAELQGQELQSKTEDLELALINAREASEAKGQFLASMSHEIRTPMNGVIGMLNLLLKEPLSKKQKRCADLAQSSAKSLLTLINDILDFSKIEAGKLVIETVSFEPHGLLFDLAESFRHQIEDKGLSLDVSLDPNTKQIVKGDPGRIRQIIINLMGNALKFTEEGTITIKAELVESANSETLCLHCEVIDTGIGIPKKSFDKLFDSFTQADSSTTRHFGGTGLGLAIVRQLCKLMNGNVTVSSELGLGSCFEFSIELAQTDSLIQGKCESTGTQSLVESSAIDSEKCYRILLVEDNAINQEVIKGALDDLNVQLDVAWNGQEALDILDSHDGAAYELILMDCQMPVMDGYTATKTIRSRKEKFRYQDIPIIAITANAMMGDKESCLEAGMNDFLTKPVDHELLEACLLKWLGIEQSTKIAPVSDASVFSTSDEIDSSVWDRAAALARVKNKEERLDILVNLFLEGMPDRIHSLSANINDGDTEQASKMAHQIKGVCANLSIHELFELSKAMELLGKENDIESMRSLMPVLRGAFERIESTLQFYSRDSI